MLFFRADRDLIFCYLHLADSQFFFLSLASCSTLYGGARTRVSFARPPPYPRPDFRALFHTFTSLFLVRGVGFGTLGFRSPLVYSTVYT